MLGKTCSKEQIPVLGQSVTEKQTFTSTYKSEQPAILLTKSKIQKHKKTSLILSLHCKKLWFYTEPCIHVLIL